MSPIEKRVLGYLDQRGPTHRSTVVCDLASPQSRIGRNGGRHNGSNGATPMIMARWCHRLIKDGLVREVREYRHNWYQHHEITDAGRKALRSATPTDQVKDAKGGGA
jgi:DNA-binding MarR family transcriptional regulator